MDQLSYSEFLDDFGLTQEQVTAMVEFEGDRVEFHPQFTDVSVRESAIHGKGLFANVAFMDGDIVAQARGNGMRTPAGRYINHAAEPNCKFANDPNNDDLWVVALADISVGDEITISYAQAMAVNGAGFVKRFNFADLIALYGFDISEYSNRQKIDVIEWIVINKIGNILDQLEVRHTVHGGMYAREMTIPAGIILTGKIHNFDHINIMSKGDISIMTDDGMMRLQAPFTGKANAGLRRVGYAHSETVWTTIHATDETDIPTIEGILFDDSDISWVDEVQRLICQQE